MTIRSFLPTSIIGLNSGRKQAGINSDRSSPTLSKLDVNVARRYVDASRAMSTRHAYNSDWRRFVNWCVERNADALPASPALVAMHLSSLAARGLAPNSVGRALAGIGYVHRRAGFLPPHRTEGGQVVIDVVAGIRRDWPSSPNRKAPADAEVLSLVLLSITGNSIVAQRDRALLTFGMAMAARRSELVALDVADLTWEERGLLVTIRHSKTDQESDGAVVAIPEGQRLTPLAHLRAWLAAAAITDGPVFRPLWRGGKVRPCRLSSHAVARILKERAAAANLDPMIYSGHSLRAGFVTAAARAGADVWKIQQVSRHKSIQVLSDYVRDARLFDNHAGKSFL